MAGKYPSSNDRDFNLLAKITENTAQIADSPGGGVTSLINDPGITLSAATGDVTIGTDVQGVLNQLSTDHGAILFRAVADWEMLSPGTAGQLLQTQGAAADPKWVSATGGAGDVNGPASSTDNAIVRFDGAGGKTIQNSAVSISDAGAVSTAGSVTASGGLITSTQIQATAGGALNLQNSASDAQANILNIGGAGASIIDFRTASTSRLTIGAAGPVGITSTATATASSAGGGALQVGANVGLSGNAGGASYFGGAVTASGDITATGNPTTVFRSTAANNNALAGLVISTGNGGSLQTWQVAGNVSGASGEFTIRDSTAATTALTITNSTLAAVFGGSVTTGGTLQLPAAPAAANRYILTGTSNTGTGQLVIQAGGGSASWGGTLNLFETAHATKGGWVGVGLGVSGAKFTINSVGFSDSGEVASIDRSGAATFAGAVAIGNTVGAAVSVASTHKVTMVIGGVTYYLLATNVP